MQGFCNGCNTFDQLVRFKVIEHRVAGCCGYWMCLIGEAMLEDAGAAFECVDCARGNEYRAERCVATGDSLPDENEIGFHVPLLNGKRLSGATHAGHDFVGAQQGLSVSADFRTTRDVAFAGQSGAQSGADDRLKNECGRSFTAWTVEKLFKFVGACEAIFPVLQRCIRVIRKAGADVTPLRKQRLVGGAASDVAADSHGPEGAAVIALPARNHAKALRLAGFEMVLARKFDRRFSGFRTTGCEVDAAPVLEIGRSELQKPGGKFLRRRGMKLRRVRECKL